MGKKILISEDDPINRDLMVDVLAIKEYEIIVAENGLKVLELTRKYLPDLILMDIQMPVVDGLEATRRLKANPRTSHIPVIALTALAMKGDEERIKSAGCDDYISKPVDIDLVLRKVEKYLG